jgi:hypothetical protein
LLVAAVLWCLCFGLSLQRELYVFSQPHLLHKLRRHRDANALTWRTTFYATVSFQLWRATVVFSTLPAALIPS